MPSNSATHAARMLKVKQGFTAAKLTSGQVDQLMRVFDVLTEADATKVAQRTEFSVSTTSKMSASVFGSGRAEERRQMARAILFVDDLAKLYDDVTLPTKPTDGQFETLWRGDFAALATRLTANAKSLCDTDFKVREILAAPVVSSARPVPRRVVITDDMRTLFDKTLTNQALRSAEIGRGVVALQIHKTAWSDAKSGLVACFAATITSSMSNMMAVQTAASGAYVEFEGFFRDVGKENEAKIGMAKSLFGALASYAPFPLSVVGKIGGAACGLLHASTSITQERALGPHKYFDSNIPTLEKFNTKLGAVKNWTTELTRLGVDGGVMPSGTSIHNAIDMARGRTVTLLNKVFLESVSETYGLSPDDTANKGTEFYLKVEATLVPGGSRPTFAHAVRVPGPGPARFVLPTHDKQAELKAQSQARPEAVAQMAINKTTAIFNATKEAIQSSGTLTVVNSATIQPFIELQLMAEYLAVLIPNEDFTKAIPEALIKRLENAPFELVQRKTGDGQTDKIYELKKLPWVAGHPRHVGALVYFFRWYKRSVNPFDLATGRVTATGVREAMATAIGEIGTAVQAHKVTRRGRSADTADWTRVAGDVARIRGV